MADELSIKITREKDGTAPSLTNMSLDAAHSVKVFIESFTEYAKAHSEDSHIKILDTGSAIDNILTLPEANNSAVDGNSASDEILDVVNSESESDDLVKVFNLIRKRISENGLSYEVNLKQQNRNISLTEKFKSVKFVTKQQTELPLQEEVVFVQGEIYASGGMTVTNIHIKPKKGRTVSVICSKEQAREFSKRLYANVFVSAVKQWRKPKEVTLQLLDTYQDEEQFLVFKKLYSEYSNSYSSERFDSLRNDLIETITKHGVSSPRISKIMRLYNHELSDRGMIRTVLFILKPLRHDDSIKDLYHNLAMILKNGNVQHSYENRY